MTGPPVAMQTVDGRGLVLDAIVAQLAREFVVDVTGPRGERRTRLDTFDRRLEAAGLELRQRTGAADSRLELGRADGAVTVAELDRNALWPAFAQVLPAGPVRDAVAPVAGIRALVVVATERRRLRGLELRNGDRKLVARLELDEPAAGDLSAAGLSPARLTVRPLRGYAGEGRRAVGLLVDAGLQEDPGVPRRPDAAPARRGGTPPTGDSTEPAAALLARVLTGFSASMLANVPGVLDDVDSEFLHDLRVALRRTRATLRLGRPVLGPERAIRWEPEFRWLGAVTAPVRDLDVYALGLPAMARWLVAADAADLEPFAAHVRRRREAARAELVRALRSARFRRLVQDWPQQLGELAEASRDALGAPSAAELAGAAIARAHRRVVRGGAAIAPDTPADDLHTLRGRCKDLRYALEVFAPILAAGPRKRAIADLTGLQDVLGRFQDSQVQRDALQVFAGEMMADGTTARALLAMGELIGHLDTDQRMARAEFDDAYARFAARSTDKQLRALGGIG
ncbi:CHAD domain-containing protein [Pengzhenrongella sicca]|uniref:CHAD domain-containing protein n=1 Tax=Pengzhenrongella sicca TaxID=2819238 RepID=A0A8A4ZCF3_9MICO|nr:CHAD domain-containing protein [Pengzhenrongella sicca]QTE28177.1 CHAD domain-containing protein [Pengzhenrongella sicca]